MRSPKSQATYVYEAEVVQLQFYTKPIGKASFAPHGNANWTSKPSALNSSPIGYLVRTTANLTRDNTNSCASMQLHARSPAPKANATSQEHTVS